MDLLLNDTKVPIILRPLVGHKTMAFRWVKDGLAKYSGEKVWRANSRAESCVVLDADDEGLKVRFKFDQESSVPNITPRAKLYLLPGSF